MCDEVLGEVKIIITTGVPKIIVTTHKDGRPVEVTIEKIKWSNGAGRDRVFIKKLDIQSLESTANGEVS